MHNSCEHHWEKADCKCWALNEHYEPIIILTIYLALPMTYSVITLHEGNHKVQSYTLERSISPKQMQSWEIKQREITYSILGHTTMVLRIPTELRGSN